METKKSSTCLICVLIGEVGCGKTTIFNKICGTKHKADIEFDSSTRGLALHPASFGKNPFELIDSPGLGSLEDRLTHAVLLRHCLTF
jgi:GTP-binding protein EngB required for normal cell division